MLTHAVQRLVPAFPHARQSFFRSPSRFSPGLRTTSSSLPPNSPHTRTMSSAPTKKEFLCILPDKPGMQAKRLEVRPAHLAGVKPNVESGILVAGGAMLEAHPAEGETPSFKGSMLLALAESEAEVRALLEKDVYVSSGVWDMEKAQIIPFKSAVREQLKL